MALRETGRGNVYKWKSAGQELTGWWRGFKDGKFERPLGIIEEEESGDKIVFACPTVLELRLKEVERDHWVRVRYKGDAISDAGRTYRDFHVTWDDERVDVPEEVGF